METKAALEEARLRRVLYLLGLEVAGVRVQTILLRRRGRRAADRNGRLTARLSRLEGVPPVPPVLPPPAPPAPPAELSVEPPVEAVTLITLKPDSPVTLIRLKPDSPRRDSTDYLDPPLPAPSLRLEGSLDGLGESASRRATASPQPPVPPPRASIDGAGKGFRWLVAQQQQLGLGLQLKLEQQHALRQEVNRALRLMQATLSDLEADLDLETHLDLGGDSQSASRRSTIDVESASRRATASPPLLLPPPSSWTGAAAEGGGDGAEGGGGGGGGGSAAAAAAWLSEAMRSAEGAEAEGLASPPTDNTEPAAAARRPPPPGMPPVDSKPPAAATEPAAVERSNSFVGSLLSAGHKVFTSFGRSAEASPPADPTPTPTVSLEPSEGSESSARG